MWMLKVILQPLMEEAGREPGKQRKCGSLIKKPWPTTPKILGFI